MPSTKAQNKSGQPVIRLHIYLIWTRPKVWFHFNLKPDFTKIQISSDTQSSVLMNSDKVKLGCFWTQEIQVKSNFRMRWRNPWPVPLLTKYFGFRSTHQVESSWNSFNIISGQVWWLSFWSNHVVKYFSSSSGLAGSTLSRYSRNGKHIAVLLLFCTSSQKVW